MANVIFKPRTLTGTSPQSVYLIYRFGRNDKLVYPTGLKINPQYWNKRSGRVRNLIECAKESGAINAQLDRLKTETDRFIMQLKASGKHPTKENLRLFLDGLANPEYSSKPSLTDFINDFVESSPAKINPATGRCIKISTVYSYRSFKKCFAGFETDRKRKYDFGDIDLDFYNDFIDYLRNAGLSTNTAGRYIRILKTVLNEATDRGVNNNTAYKSRRFKVLKENTDAVYLDENELNRLYGFDFSCNRLLEKVRDLFLVGAWTGLRFSDFVRISKEHVKDRFIEIEQQKTGNTVLVPLHPVVSEIWRRYGEELPSVISNRRLNIYIKEVCRMAGISKDERKSITKGGIRISKHCEKWELVSSHTARRSFATNLYLSGFPALSIMRITGHRTEEAFMHYIKVTPRQHAELLQNHWAQNGNFLQIAK